MEKQAEVCRISPVVFERFVPGGNTLAIVRDKKIVFLDATTCKEIKELNVSPLSGYETYLAFSPDGQEFAIARDSNSNYECIHWRDLDANFHSPKYLSYLMETLLGRN